MFRTYSSPRRSGYPVRSSTPEKPLTTLLANMAIQDWLFVGFHFFMWFRVLLAPSSPTATSALVLTSTLFALTVVTVLVVRGEVLSEGRGRALVYRVGTFVPNAASYLTLRIVLPALQPSFVDAELLALDEAIFGVTPAVWMAQFNTPLVVEFFAFFYYSYFVLLAAFFVPTVFVDHGRRALELLTGGFLVVGAAHISYTLVPALGPYATLDFDAPLRGGFWWSQVTDLVDAAGARSDVFPSLHTALPTYIALQAFAYRGTSPYRWLWPAASVLAIQIATAAVFLRWHWAIDIAAGILLALASRWGAAVLVRREVLRGSEGDSRQPVWEPLFRWQRSSAA